ncbi:MarR family transcriptional regulator [Caldibacillus lycopersici]|uniref:MarR family transcriptional regulator n=1 Tax=Perspicuibacillus lycopersici TaxID=1325689 RepID=A0AAE3LP09_9BACI|nr:MarR family transcriptional regulator [Perspicuibacillus lycopersici]MCU9614427.1 MarR family transcriptional regulator [Perspicuibacillus lycopersici]
MEGFFRRFIKLYRPLISQLNHLLSDYNLSYSHWQIIYFIKEYGPSTLVEIANYYHVEKPSITRNVHRLEENSLVIQIPGKDKREKIIQLTNTGEEIYQACRKKITALEMQIMEGIPEEQQQAVFEMLPKVRNNILKKEGHNE